MPDFCGDPDNIAVQKRLLARQDWIADDPSVANGGRVLNVVDVAAFGWDRVRDIMEEDRLIAFVVQDAATFTPVMRRELGDGYDYPEWQVYRGSVEDVRAACTALADRFPLPPGWRIDNLDHPDDDQIAEVQALNMATGVAPYPAWYSAGKRIGCVTTILWSNTRQAVASASVVDKYHRDGRLGGTVFKGSTCVRPDHRGRGLGKLVNAHNLLASLATRGWEYVISQVRTTNAASQRTIGACGLAPVPGCVSLAALPRGEVFTR